MRINYNNVANVIQINYNIILKQSWKTGMYNNNNNIKLTHKINY